MKPCRLQKKEEKPFDDLVAALEDYLLLNRYVCYAILIALLILCMIIFILICYIIQPPTYGYLWW